MRHAGPGGDDAAIDPPRKVLIADKLQNMARESARPSHWSRITVPYQLHGALNQLHRTGGDRKMAEQMIKKVIFADQMCGSATPMRAMRALVDQM